MKYKKFLKFQILQIWNGELSVLPRKIKKLFILSIEGSFIIFLIPIILVVRFLGFFILIRFGELISSRIGHYAGNTELYLCELDVGIQPQKAIDFFFNGHLPVCNKQLYLMWNRTLRINKVTRYFFAANRFVPGSEKHTISVSCNDRDIHNLFERTSLHLKFTSEELKRGLAEQANMGIPQGARFVLIHARGPAYLEKVYQGADCYYHSYRDSDIEKFIPAAELLAEQGYYIIRMGACPEKPLSLNHPRVIDYASYYRNEFMDIFLGANCHFYLGDSCGINAIPFIFRKPVAITNFVPLEYAITWGSNNLFIPKKHWLNREKRFMTFKEIFHTGAGRFLKKQKFDAAGITLVENTPEEIAVLAVEMDERLNGMWQITKEDEKLQRIFWDIFPKSELHGEIVSRIGTEFLKQNHNLFR